MVRLSRILALVIVAQVFGHSTVRGQQLGICYVDGTISCLDAVLFEGLQNGWDLSCEGCEPNPVQPDEDYCTGAADTVHMANASVNIEYATGYPQFTTGNTQGKVSTTSGATKVCGVIVECTLGCTNDICDTNFLSNLDIARKYASGSICYTDLQF